MSHERPSRDDANVPWLLFAGIAAFFALIAAVYWFKSYEEAGTVMLALSACLATFCAVYLRRQRTRAPELVAAGHDEPGHYLPAASLWPFGIGLSAFLLTNGLVLGVGFAVPGAVVMAASIAGFARQSRHRR
jgi:hypothetical protein